MHDAEQQTTGGAGVNASETGSIVKTATSQVTLVINTESADEAAAAPKQAGLEAPDVTFSTEKANVAVMKDAEMAAAAPNAAGQEAPDETVSSQERDVKKSMYDSKAAPASKAADLEAPDATASSWEAAVAGKGDADEAAAAMEADKRQAARKERQRVYLNQAFGRSVSHRPLIILLMLSATAKRSSVSLGRHGSAGMRPSLMLLLVVLDGLTQSFDSRCTPNGTSLLSACEW